MTKKIRETERTTKDEDRNICDFIAGQIKKKIESKGCYT